MGRGKEASPQSVDPTRLANEFNPHYSRFHSHIYKDEIESICAALTHVPVTLKEKDVISMYSNSDPWKTAGPDGVAGNVLKECTTQLGPVFRQLFEMFLDISLVP